MNSFDKTNNPEEIVDLVNKKDEIVGKAKKKEVNSNPKLIHREVAIIVVNSNNEILLQKRSEKKMVDPNLWTISVLGHVPKGMTPLDAAHMEIKEEIGFDTNLKFLYKELIHYDNETHFCYLYKGNYEGQKIVIEPAEIQEVKFVTKEEFENMLKEEGVLEPHSVKRMKKFWREQ